MKPEYILAALILLAFGIVGEMDFREATAESCRIPLGPARAIPLGAEVEIVGSSGCKVDVLLRDGTLVKGANARDYTKQRTAREG
jgi:hypothetical protein